MLSFLSICFVFLSLTTAQQKLPNIGYLGIGYDIIKGNPQPTTLYDPGFLVPLFELEYKQNRTTPDDHFLIPDTVDVIQVRACSYDTETDNVFGETSYMETLKSSIEVKGSFLIASFTASYDYQKISNQTTTERRIGIAAKAVCSEYKATLMEFLATPLSPNFMGAIQFLSSLPPNSESSGYFKVIEAFGTHYTTSITMGAKCSLQSLFTQEVYSSFIQSGYSFSTGASASFKMFSGGISGMTSKEVQEAQQYDSSRTILFESYLGSHPSTDGKWQTWAQSVAESPYPFEYSLTPISSLLTSYNFPSFNPQVLSTVQQKLENYIKLYCSTIPSASCSGPAPDRPPISYSVVSNAGAGDFYASCPTGYSLLGTGFMRQDTKHEDYPGYLFSSATTAHCYDYFGGTCFGTCTNAIPVSDVWIGTSHGTTVTVTCPDGYLVTGCAMQLDQSHDEGFPYAYMNSKSSCMCYDNYGVTCQAACVPAHTIKDSEIKSNYGTGIVDVVCPTGKQALGCGYKPQVGVKGECCWYVYPSENKCTCYDYFGATCYAVCANVYDVV